MLNLCNNDGNKLKFIVNVDRFSDKESMQMEKIKVEVDADLQDLIPQFLENRKKDLETLRGLVEKKDIEGLAALAHKIKGAAAGYGFAALSHYAAQIEVAAKKNDFTPIPQLVSEMKGHFENVEVLYVAM